MVSPAAATAALDAMARNEGHLTFRQSDGLNPNGSLKLTGSPLANPYRFNPPARPIGSSWVISRFRGPLACGAHSGPSVDGALWVRVWTARLAASPAGFRAGAVLGFWPLGKAPLFW